MFFNLVWIWAAVIRDNTGIWSEHHQSYPWSPPHPRGHSAHSSSPSLDVFKLLPQKPASRLQNGLAPADDRPPSRRGPGAECDCALFQSSESVLSLDWALQTWLPCVIIIWEAYYRNIFWWYLCGYICSPPTTPLPGFIRILNLNGTRKTHSSLVSVAWQGCFFFFHWGLCCNHITIQQKLCFCSSASLSPFVHIPRISRIISSELADLFCLLSGNFEMPQN